MLPEIEYKKSLLRSKNILAFSLIELSFLIVIIAAIIAMISGAKSLSQATHSKVIVAEVNKYKQASNNFFEKYGYLAGDFPFSDQYFGAKCDNVASNCNGNGNNLVNFIDSSVLDDTTNKTSGHSEPLLFWRHLALAGFIHGDYIGKVQNSFDGRSCNNHYACCFGSGDKQGCPESEYNEALHSFISWPNASGDKYSCGDSGDYYPKNVNVFQVANFVENTFPLGGVMSARLAYNIDKKFDDGVPTDGLILGKTGYDFLSGGLGDCVLDSSDDSTTSNNITYGADYYYNNSISERKCFLGFVHLENSLCKLP